MPVLILTLAAHLAQAMAHVIAYAISIENFDSHCTFGFTGATLVLLPMCHDR